MKASTVYVLHPGEVISQNDLQRHFIGVGQLMALYRVPRDARVIVSWHDRDGRHGLNVGSGEVIHCYPRYDGKYPMFDER